jgi:NAD(P)-dependent dehydrogenase (short-subunit alcohol dehydrogenase family)
VITDLQPTESCAKVVEQTIRTFGRIDALINNANGNDGVGLALGSPDKFVVPAPGEIAAMVVFLSSAQASHISRQHGRVDGGYVYLDRALT